MDAAEIARLRENSAKGYRASWDDVFSLIDALEQARKERDEAWTAVRVRDEQINVTVKKRTAQRDQAQKDAKDAHALLAEAGSYIRGPELRARIEAMLEPPR